MLSAKNANDMSSAMGADDIVHQAMYHLQTMSADNVSSASDAEDV